MSFLNRITIRSKLFASLALGAILLIGIVTIAINNTQLLSRIAVDLAEVSIQGLGFIIEADRDMQQALVAERSMLLANGDNARLKSLQNDHSENIEQAITRAKKYAAIAQNPKGKELATQFEAAHKKWTDITKNVVLLSQKNDPSAIELSYGESSKAFEDARSLLNEITEIEQEASKQAALRAEQKADSAFSLILIGGIISVVIFSLMAFVFPRMVVNPIQGLTNRLNDIAQGEGNLVARLSVNRGDEIGALAIAFNNFIEKIHNLVKNVDQITAQLNSSSSDLASVANHTQVKISQQRTETGMVASAMTEMSASIQDVARSAGSAAQAAREADQQSARGEAAVDGTISRISNLADAVEKVGQVIQRLDADSQNIGKVLDVIRGIAEQTNLLALNAAIEAARAGEQGRGFAVVADEVRTLASRTQESTNEIMDMIQRLQNGASEAVATMESGHAATQETVTQANNTKQVLDAIKNAVSSISDMNTQIATAAEEQSAVAEELNRNITVISDISDENAKSSEETAQASSKLSNLAEQLQQQVGAFKI